MLFSDVSEHPVCSIFTGSVSRKKNQDEIDKAVIINIRGHVEGRSAT